MRMQLGWYARLTPTACIHMLQPKVLQTWKVLSLETKQLQRRLEGFECLTSMMMMRPAGWHTDAIGSL